MLGVNCVNGFSGCPGDGPRAVNPNWVTCAWPDEYREILDWQWKEKVIPYWTEQAAFLKKKKVRFCIEMHPGFVVYNPEGLLRLRCEVGKNGDAIGANFDPSHLVWQHIDYLRALRDFGDRIVHFHAKDTRIDADKIFAQGIMGLGWHTPKLPGLGDESKRKILWDNCARLYPLAAAGA